MEKIGKLLLAVLLTITFMVFPSGAVTAEEPIVLVDGNWASENAAHAVMHEFLTNYLKVPVKVQFLTGAEAAWVAMDKGTVDIQPEIWWPNQLPLIRKYVEQRKTVELQLLYPEARQGFYVPTWVSKKYGITKAEDLKGKGELFNFTGDKRGDLWLGGFGWLSNDINRVKLREYGLIDEYEPFVVDVWVFLVTLKEAMRKKKPIAFYYCEPDWIYNIFDLTLLEEPAFSLDKWKTVKTADGKRMDVEKSYFACEWRPALTFTAFPKTLKQKNPKVYELVQNFYLPLKDIFGLIADAEECPGNPKTPYPEVAKKYLKDHPEIVKNWMDGSKYSNKGTYPVQ